MTRADRVAAAQKAADAWVDQVWESTTLRPLERLVALAYADWVGDDVRSVWIYGPTLRQRTGLSRDGANRALRGLKDAGWLTVTRAAAQHQSTRYALTLPPEVVDAPADEPQPSASQNAEEPPAPQDAGASVLSRGTLRRSSVPPQRASVLPERASVPPRGTDPSTYPSTHPPLGKGSATSAPTASAGPDDGGRTEHRWTAAEARAAHEAVAAAVEVPAELVDVILGLALTDPDTLTSPTARLRVAAYRAELVKRARAQLAAGQRADAVSTRLAGLRATIERAGEAGDHALREARHALPKEHPDALLVFAAAVQNLAEAERAVAASA